MIKKIKVLFSTILLLLTINVAFSQSNPFDFYLEPLNISNLPGVQSYCWGQSNGKWLIVGGRIDGLHQRQPFASFAEAGNNKQLIVVDPVTQSKWTSPLTTLSASLQEQLSSTNMEFYQDGDFLYLIGGYGYSNTATNHITFSNLIAVNVPGLIDAIINGTSVTGYFRQLSDPQFAVTGGQLKKMYGTYYLAGGNKFTGRYNPVGNPTYTQLYTNQIRKFKINDNGVSLSVTHLTPLTDTVNLHRRDYNVLPQILPSGEFGLNCFSGVFQYTADLPFLNALTVDSSSFNVINSFAQYYNHYHCANIPIFSEKLNEMHSVFFGGIAQYYDNNGILTQDNNVPFVKTIARVTRGSNGNMAEFKLPTEMPGLLGASAEFIPVENLPTFDNHVIKLDSLSNDTTLIGYIFGGINSTAPNIFMVNNGTQSSASSVIYKVHIIKNQTYSLHEINKQSNGTIQLQVSPNPNNGAFLLRFNLLKSEKVILSIFDSSMKLITSKDIIGVCEQGQNTIKENIPNHGADGIYFISIQTDNETALQKVILRK